MRFLPSQEIDMAQKPSIPKGTRDFNPEEVAKRNYIFDTIRSQFELFGFQPIETPSFENSETLMGKYGEEGDRLIFKILNSGNYLVKTQPLISSQFQSIFEYSKEFVINFLETLKQVINKEYANLKIANSDFKLKTQLAEFITINLEDIVEKTNYNFEFNDYIESSKKFIFHNSLKISHTITGIDNFFNSDYQNNFIENSLAHIYGPLSHELFTEYFLFDSTSNSFSPLISEKALRYDLTVPFARYVVQHQNEIEFPFKRYQIQPVWRADRPQKGRFREFYQCDADVVGSTSLWQEVEFVQLYDAVFSALKLEGVTIKINNRKILSGIAEVIGAQDKLIDFTVALDKLDKIGEEKVKEEMLGKGIPQSGIDKLQPLFNLSGSFESQISQLKSILNTSEQGKKGIEELEFINKAISDLGLKTATLQLDVTLARGLNYYTGAIFEVSAPKTVDMGSIGGGGRYDDLTGIFGLKDMSGVGISFGLDRIYLVLEALDLFPETISNTVKALFINFGEKEAFACLKTIKELRSHGIKAELYPDASTSKKQFIKQMNHADKRKIPNVVLVGESELESNTFTLKNMGTGEQEQLNLSELINKLK